MDFQSNIRFTRALVLMIWLSLVMVSSLSSSYPLETSVGEEGKEYSSEGRALSDLRLIRSLLNEPSVQMPSYKHSVYETSDNSRQKRMQFGFSGLDTIDHIMSTLDRKTKPLHTSDKAHKGDSDIYYLMKVNG